MGFYQPAQIVIDARNHGVEVLPVDINFSNWDNLLENKPGKYRALRLGFRQVKGIREDDMTMLVSARKKMFTSINELRDAGVTEAALEKLADADAFRSLGLDRRQALWNLSAKDRPIALFSNLHSPDADEEKVSLPVMKISEHVVHDYASTSLSLKAHPVSFVREKLQQLHIMSTGELSNAKDGQFVKVAGLVLVRQRPGTAGGICFMTIEDETGYANLVIVEKLFDTYRNQIIQSRLIMVEGKLQREGEVIHVIVSKCHDFSKLLRSLTSAEDQNLPLLTLSRADEKSIPPGIEKKKQETPQEKLFPDARNFR